MKWLFIIVLFKLSILADIYYAKIEPLESYSIKAATNGEVIFSNTNLEGKIAENEVVVKLDDELNKKTIQELKEAIKNIKERIEVLTQISEIKFQNYERVKNLTTKSQLEKERELSDYLSAKAQLLSTKEQLSSLKMQLDKEEDSLKNKTIYAKGLYIYKIHVKKGDYVVAGTKLFDAFDISKAKITIFITKEDLKALNNATIYINDKEVSLEIKSLSKVADNEFVSSYRLEIIIPKNSDIFSELAKVEIVRRN